MTAKKTEEAPEVVESAAPSPEEVEHRFSHIPPAGWQAPEFPTKQ